MALGLSGVIIEKTYSRAQGRSPVPNYQADIFWGRAQKKMISAGFNDEKIAEAAQYIVGNLSSVVSGLANAGMR